MSELRARARVLYNALNFDTPVNFGQEELFAKGLGEDKYVEMNNVGQTERHLGYLDTAAPSIARSLEITRRLTRAFPTSLYINRIWRGSKPEW
jgi:hypothetical protein